MLITCLISECYVDWLFMISNGPITFLLHMVTYFHFFLLLIGMHCSISIRNKWCMQIKTVRREVCPYFQSARYPFNYNGKDAVSLPSSLLKSTMVGHETVHLHVDAFWPQNSSWLIYFTAFIWSLFILHRNLTHPQTPADMFSLTPTCQNIFATAK